MKFSFKYGCLLALIPPLVFLGYFLYEVLGVGKFPTVWNQKVTVVVEAPSGLLSASSVTEMKIVPTGSLTGDGRTSNTYLRGEAVVLDLGVATTGPRYLFALIRRFRKPPENKIAVVPPANYPLLVTFEDITKPETVKKVDPNNLAATFGPGYSLKSITLEITDEPVTEGKVEQVLGWLPTAEFIIPFKLRPEFKAKGNMSAELSLRPSDFIDGNTLKRYREGTK